MAKDHWDQLPPAAKWEEEEPEDYWEKKLQESRQKPAHAIKAGKSLTSNSPIFITPKQLSTHMHVIGGTGGGKSYFVEGIIKSLIMQGHGLCLIDPHGDLYDHVLDFCVHLDQAQPERGLSGRVIPFDVGERSQIIGFNPVQRNARVMTYQVLALMESIRKVWGQDSFESTPRLARWLFNAAYAVIEGNLTMLQMQYLVDPKPNPYREAITQRMTTQRIKEEWDWFANLRDRDRNEFTESSFNRIQVFVVHELIRQMLGQRTRTLDFNSVLSGQKILLVNLAKQNVIPEDYQHLLGTLLVNEIMTAAFARRPEKRTPFFMFIDEFQHFVTKDMCEILDGGRKFGLHLILAHQHLNQLKIKDPEVYYSTLTNARTKIVFGGLNDEDLEILAKELYTGELDPNEIKDEIWQTKLKPVETTRTIRSDSWGESEGEGYGSASNYGQVTHSSLSAGETYIPGSGLWSGDLLQGTNMVSATGYGSASGMSQSHSSQSASSRGSSVVEVPWYEYHESEELSSRTFRNLEEQLYIKKAQLKRQPQQHAALLIPDSTVQLLKTYTLKNFPTLEKEREEFKSKCFESAGCYKSPEDAEREAAQLEGALLTGHQSVIEISAPIEENPNPKKNKKTIFAGINADDVIGRE